MCQKMCSFLLNWYEWNLKLVIIALAMVFITRVQSLAPAGILLFIAGAHPIAFQWVLGESSWSIKLTTHVYQVLRLRMSGLLLLHSICICTSKTLLILCLIFTCDY